MIHHQGRWAVVTGASSGLGRGFAALVADRGMALLLTGRNEARWDEVARQIRRAVPGVKVETVAADFSTRSGVSALLEHVGDRPIGVAGHSVVIATFTAPPWEAIADYFWTIEAAPNGLRVSYGLDVERGFAAPVFLARPAGSARRACRCSAMRALPPGFACEKTVAARPP
jgi:NAD(P)-dependent dehydrogenase (short-subunit alcohol dehydrogenase family)